MTAVHPPTRGQVLVIGESIVDIVQHPHSMSTSPGGSPANVAFGLARLGVATDLCTQFGDDPDGEILREHLEVAGVGLLCMGAENPTSTALTVLGADGGAHYSFGVTWTLARPPSVEGYRLLHTSSIASFMQPGADTVLSAVNVAKGPSLISYDPNIRPELMGEQREAVSLFEEFATHADVVKLSDEDAQWLYPGRSLHDVLTRLQLLGASLAMVTRGGEGAILRSARTELSVPAIPAQVVDTIGAGDSFMSALIAGLLQQRIDNLDKQALHDLGGAAVRAAALTVSRRGACPPTLAELAARHSTLEAMEMA